MNELPQKFSFAVSFDHVEKLPPGETIHSQAAKDLVRTQGIQEGYLQGFQDGRGETLKAVETIAHLLHTLVETYEEIKKTLHQDSVKIAYGMVKVLFPKYAPLYAEKEIMHLVAEALQERPEEKKIQIFVSPSVREPMIAFMEELRSQGVSFGDLCVEGDQALKPPECRIVWEEGRCERLLTRVWEDIQQAVSRLVPAEEEDILKGDKEEVAQGPLRTFPSKHLSVRADHTH